MADIPSRLAVSETKLDELRKDLKDLLASHHRLGNKHMELEKAQLLVRQDVSLIKKLTFGACGLILTAFVGNMVKLSTDYSQIESIKKLILEHKQ